MSSDSDKPGGKGPANGSGPEPAKPAAAPGAQGNGKAGPAGSGDKGAGATPARVLSGSVSKKSGPAERRVLTASIEKPGDRPGTEDSAATKKPAAAAAPEPPDAGASRKEDKPEPAAAAGDSQPKAAVPGKTGSRATAAGATAAAKPQEKAFDGPEPARAGEDAGTAKDAAAEEAAPTAAEDRADDTAAAKQDSHVELRAPSYPFDEKARRQRRVWPLLLFLLLVIAGGLGWLYWDLQGDTEGGAPAEAMTVDELREFEELLAKLEFAPGEVDGIVDDETRAALRLFQEFAGLPIDGEPTSALLEELREVAGMM